MVHRATLARLLVRATNRVPLLLAMASIGAGYSTGCSTTIRGGAAADAPPIGEVSILGNSQVDDGDIVDGLANRSPEGIFRRTYRRLDPLALEQDIARIESYYARRGFYSAKVIATKIEKAARNTEPGWGGFSSVNKPSAKDGPVRVTFRVREGQPTRVAGLSLIGLSPLLRRSKMLDVKDGPLQPGEVFRHDYYLEFKRWVQGWMAHRGYPHAQLEGKVEVDRDAHTADIRLIIDDGPLARFGATRIGGLDEVPESAVRNRLAWEPGERFRPERLELTQGRLYQLGLFASVRMDYEKQGRPRITDIDISLTEARPFELRLGGGLAINGGFNTKNMRIEARQRTDFIWRGVIDPLSKLHVEARPAWQWNLAEKTNSPAGEANATLDRADLFLPRMVGSVTLGFQRDAFEAYVSQGPSVRLGLVRPFFSDQLKVDLGWRFRRLTFSELDSALNGITPQPEPAEGEEPPPEMPNQDEIDVREAVGLDRDPYLIGAYEQTVSFDRRDQPLDARKGVFAAISVTEGLPAAASDLRFVRATGDLRGYLSIGRRLVLAARTFYGRRLGQDTLPITERFFDGGASGHRGFGFRRLSPYVDTPFMGQDATEQAVIGGDETFLGTGEVRVDVGKLLNFPFGVVGFTDAGDVVCIEDSLHCTGETGLNFGNLHWAVGAGVRWTPVISVRVDVGYRLNRVSAADPDPANKVIERIAFHISLGQAF
jgi:outer membrane protein assembly factor BamA